MELAGRNDDASLQNSQDGSLKERMQHRKITRNRELRACTECRRRKLRCDRQLPCSSCFRRNEPASCLYEKNLVRLQSAHAPRSQAEAKLEHLEKLVQELSQSRQTLTKDDLTTTASIVQCGKDEMPDGSLYNGATHWSAMLEDIEELRFALRDQDDAEDVDADLDSDDSDGTALLLGATSHWSLQEVLAHFLPPRQECDRLVATYFKARTVVASFIHSVQFSRLYKLFWDDSSVTSPLWVSILFSIFDIASRTMSMSFKASAGKGCKENRFAIAAAYCLTVGGYHRPQPFTMEALLLYIQARCMTSTDLSTDVAVLFGTVARLATVMGYHKDPDTSRNGMSFFECEMRRRTWSICMQLDVLISFHLGLPTNIQFPTWDTKAPASLRDSDFDVDTVQFPPARPDTDAPEMLFYVAKHRLMVVFEKILRHALSVTDQSNSEFEMIDEELRNTYNALPDIFKPRMMAESIVDSPSIIITRLCVSFIYEKCLCVLHRRGVTEGRQESVEVCYASASSLLTQFLDIYDEFEPGGQLETERWFLSSISWNDFLLGCTTLCLTLCSARRYAKLAGTATIDYPRSWQLLQNAKALCEKHPAGTRNAKKVCRLVDATILSSGGENGTSISATQVSCYENETMVVDAQGQATTTLSNGENWLYNQSPVAPMGDIAWEYLEQFLNMPADDLDTIRWQ